MSATPCIHWIAGSYRSCLPGQGNTRRGENCHRLRRGLAGPVKIPAVWRSRERETLESLKFQRICDARLFSAGNKKTAVKKITAVVMRFTAT